MKPLFKRTLSGIAILALLLGGLLVSPWIYAPVALFAMLSMIVEYFKLNVPGRKYRNEKACIFIAALILFCASFFVLESGLAIKWLLLPLFPVLLCECLMLHDCKKDLDLNVHLFFPLIYIAAPICLSVPLVFPHGEFNGALLLAVYAIAWLNDVGAYILGMSFGQRPDSRKLAPELSPKKSWIGVAGGTLFSFATAALIWKLFGADILPFVHWMAIAALISVFGVCGDLFESLIKRHSSVKDASNFIPGHGGMLDRFDDILFVIPVVTLYVKLLELV